MGLGPLGLCPEGSLSRGGLCPGGFSVQGGSLSRGARETPPVKMLPWPKLCLWAVIKKLGQSNLEVTL